MPYSTRGNIAAIEQELNRTIDSNKFPDWDFNRINETFRIAEEIFKTMTPEAIMELTSSADEQGLNQVFDTVLEETYGVLYGKHIAEKTRVTSETFGYLDKLTASMEETLRCENLTYFITSVLPQFELHTHHLEWCEIYQLYKRAAIIAARDHGKSFLFSNAIPIWNCFRFKGKEGRTQAERNNRGFIFSFSIQQAIDLLEILQNTIEEIDILRERLFDKNRFGKTDMRCLNKTRITVKGFGSSVRGAHPGWIIVDDPLKDNVLFSKLQREKSTSYLHSVIMNMIVPEGPVHIIGTPFHSSDLYGDLKTKKGWKVFEYPGIFPDGSLLWPQRWNFEGLMGKKEDQGNLIFSREILCRPISADTTIFPPNVLNTAFFGMDDYTLVHNRESYKVKFKRVVTGCDFAISGSVGADYSVFLTWGIDDIDRMWLMHVYRARGASYVEQITMLKRINIDFRPEIIYCEDNAFQQIFVQESERAGLPVIGQTTTAKKNDLQEGLPSLAILFERGKFRIPTGDQRSKDFADELALEFGSVAFTDEKGLQSTGANDDICMASFKSVEAARALTTGGLAFNFDFA
jgi:phage terminase large subunit-like protein